MDDFNVERGRKRTSDMFWSFVWFWMRTEIRRVARANVFHMFTTGEATISNLTWRAGICLNERRRKKKKKHARTFFFFFFSFLFAGGSSSSSSSSKWTLPGALLSRFTCMRHAKTFFFFYHPTSLFSVVVLHNIHTNRAWCDAVWRMEQAVYCCYAWPAMITSLR